MNKIVAAVSATFLLGASQSAFAAGSTVGFGSLATLLTPVLGPSGIGSLAPLLTPVLGVVSTQALLTQPLFVMLPAFGPVLGDLPGLGGLAPYATSLMTQPLFLNVALPALGNFVGELAVP